MDIREAGIQEDQDILLEVRLEGQSLDIHLADHLVGEHLDKLQMDHLRILHWEQDQDILQVGLLEALRRDIRTAVLQDEPQGEVHYLEIQLEDPLVLQGAHLLLDTRQVDLLVAEHCLEPTLDNRNQDEIGCKEGKEQHQGEGLQVGTVLGRELVDLLHRELVPLRGRVGACVAQGTMHLQEVGLMRRIQEGKGSFVE